MISDERLKQLIEYMLDDPGCHEHLVHSHAATDILVALRELQQLRRPRQLADAGLFPFDPIGRAPD
jgi:hypothetical protein